jgi:hypothetical protein
MFFLLFVVREKGLFGGGDQVGIRHDAIGIVVNEGIPALAILLMKSALNSNKFLRRQLRQGGLDFSNRAHGGTLAT